MSLNLRFRLVWVAVGIVAWVESIGAPKVRQAERRGDPGDLWSEEWS